VDGLKPCGTPAAYRRHLRHREEPCDACRQAELDRGEAARRAQGALPKQSLQPCGTPAAYARHRAHGETPCPPCRAAHAARVSQSRKDTRARHRKKV
jgi:hypothetical protein